MERKAKLGSAKSNNHRYDEIDQVVAFLSNWMVMTGASVKIGLCHVSTMSRIQVRIDVEARTYALIASPDVMSLGD